MSGLIPGQPICYPDESVILQRRGVLPSFHYQPPDGLHLRAFSSSGTNYKVTGVLLKAMIPPPSLPAR